MGKVSAFALAAILTAGLSVGAMAQGMSSSPSTGSSHMPSTATPSSPSGASSLSGSGSSSATDQVSSESQVKSALEAKGYSNIKSIEKSRTGWTASAEKNGKQVHVAIDEHGNVATR
jgi:hypothetical protein